MTPPWSLQTRLYWIRPGASLATSLVVTRWSQSQGAGAVEAEAAHVADVEEADAAADGLVLLDDGRVLHRHRPAAEVDHPAAVRPVPVEERGLQRRGGLGGRHRGGPSRSGPPHRGAGPISGLPGRWRRAGGGSRTIRADRPGRDRDGPRRSGDSSGPGRRSTTGLRPGAAPGRHRFKGPIGRGRSPRDSSCRTWRPGLASLAIPPQETGGRARRRGRSRTAPDATEARDVHQG